ncbi:hydroxymethylglutaryl-CoA synthase [Desulfofundulus salinus]|uniref:Hydroxymethylglutaryl-CoA synthase n=1 Tax=Desulfofundulus salinus TaxID=2419843 RepID=A0A494WRS7_9FIRM|nr:hydroxymethylglutaryl-CoA synthase [Desulfofundulus salinum]RKO65501.1 hydroxymethylglutaryl-CoA synthase [Desulfofundulus salinum]
MAVGIVGYGAYLPRLRITKKEYQQAWGNCAAGIKEKTVMDFDEDALTMGVEAAKEALKCGINPEEIEILCWASTNPPYQEKMVSGAAAVMLGLREDVIATEHGQSIRAGSEALLTAWAFLSAGSGRNALVIAADAPRACPRESIEHGLGAGGVAYILGTENLIAEIDGFNSFVSEMLGERFRPAGDNNLRDIGVRAFTFASYNQLVTRAVQSLMEKLGRKPSDYTYLVIQEIDGRSAKSVAKKLGFDEEQLAPGLLYEQTGDTGASSALLSLAAVLNQSKPGEKILLAAYGSGAGSMAVSLTVTGMSLKEGRNTVRKQLDANKTYLGYTQYLQVKRYI